MLLGCGHIKYVIVNARIVGGSKSLGITLGLIEKFDSTELDRVRQGFSNDQLGNTFPTTDLDIFGCRSITHQHLDPAPVVAVNDTVERFQFEIVR